VILPVPSKRTMQIVTLNEGVGGNGAVCGQRKRSETNV
jgi:hypothetical protein